MEKIQPIPVDAPAENTPPRPWLRAIFSGAVFGGLGAAAMHWLGFHSVAPAQRLKTSFGRNWTAAVAGIASGTVAAYGTLRADDAAPRSVFPEKKEQAPDPVVSAESVSREAAVPSPGLRSL